MNWRWGLIIQAVTQGTDKCFHAEDTEYACPEPMQNSLQWPVHMDKTDSTQVTNANIKSCRLHLICAVHVLHINTYVRVRA